MDVGTECRTFASSALLRDRVRAQSAEVKGRFKIPLTPLPSRSVWLLFDRLSRKYPFAILSREFTVGVALVESRMFPLWAKMSHFSLLAIPTRHFPQP